MEEATPLLCTPRKEYSSHDIIGLEVTEANACPFVTVKLISLVAIRRLLI